MEELTHFKDFVEKKIGLKPEMDASETTNYNYENYLPKPCDYIKQNLKNNQWECCLSLKDPNIDSSDENYSQCKVCGDTERKQGICNYVWDFNLNNDKKHLIGKNDSTDVRKNKMDLWFISMLDTYYSMKGGGVGYEDIVFGTPKNQLGSRYFYKNGLKCKDKSGKKVDAYNYSNNIIDKGMNLTNAMLNDISTISIDELINSHAVNSKKKTGKDGGGLSREYECKMITRPVGIAVDSIDDCKSGPNILSDTKCILEEKPTIEGLSIIDTLSNSQQQKLNKIEIKGYKETFQNKNIDLVNDTNNTYDKSKNNTKNSNNKDKNDYSLISLNCNCDIRIYVFLIFVFIALLILNYYIFNK